MNEDGSPAPIGSIGLGGSGGWALVALVGSTGTHAVADQELVASAELAGHPLFGVADVGLPRAAVTQRVLQTGDALVTQHPLPLAPGPDAAWLDDCMLVIVATDGLTPEAARAINVTALDRGATLVPVQVRQGVVHLGPLVQPGMGPCLRCAELRVAAATGHAWLAGPAVADAASGMRAGQAVATEVARFRAGEPLTRGTVLTVHPDGAVIAHPVLRTLWCPDCGRRGPFMPFRSGHPLALDADEVGDRQAILRAQNRLISPLTGPVVEIQPFTIEDGDPVVPRWIATVANVPGTGTTLQHYYGGGCDLLPEVARAAALGESVERLCVVEPPPAEVLWASRVDLGEDALPFTVWDLYDPATRARPDFPFRMPADDAALPWVWATALMSRRMVAIPAGRVFIELQSTDGIDGSLVSGFAAGETAVAAVVAALLEVVERDSFMIAWANRLAGTRIPIDRETPGDVGAYVAALEDVGFAVRCVAIELDLGAHLVIAMLRSDRVGEPANVISAAADPDLATACRRAVKEVTASRTYVRGAMHDAGGRLPDPVPEQVTEMLAHGLLYARSDMSPTLDLWWQAPLGAPLPPVDTSWSDARRLRHLLDAFQRADLEPLVVDLTPPEIAEIGLHVVKTLVPGTYPMQFDSRWPHFGGRRMFHAPVACGLRKAPLAVEDANRVPHPFP